MYILSVHFQHDSSAALIKDGVVVAAAAEERFVRLKHAEFLPLRSLAFCLDQAGITMKDIDLVVIPSLTLQREVEVMLGKEVSTFDFPRGELVKRDFDFWYRALAHRLLYALRKNPNIAIPSWAPNFRQNPGVELIRIDHHLAHASSSYFTSGFMGKSLVITSDGSGDLLCGTVWIAEEGKMKNVLKVGNRGSLGVFYGAVTEALGWENNDGEGKTMGLAPYGNTKKTKGVLDFMRPRYAKGKLVKPYDWGVPGAWYDMGMEYSHYYENERLIKLIKRYGRENIAAEAQRVVEDELVNYISYWVEQTDIRQLAVAGGVFLNVKANQRIWERLNLKDFHIYADSGDGGITVGAALYGYHMKNPESKIKGLTNVYFGPSYSNEEIEKLLKIRNLKYKYIKDNSKLVKTAAKLLSEGKILGWFQGRMEVGPRALGNRSILMDPRKKENKDILNARVKFREGFRPFCPSIIIEAAPDYFEDYKEAPFMIQSFTVKEDMRNKIAAVVHVDNTARPQTVTKKSNLLFYNLLTEFGKLTGVPCLINTSFNLKGEAMVCKPQDAIRTFFDSGLDYLFLGNFLIDKT